MKQNKTKHKDGQKCKIKRITNNATLHSGMDAGNFKLHGKSNNITHCAELCCLDRLCDIALIMTGRCYTVQCYSMKDCQSKNAENKSPDIAIAYIDNAWKKWRIKQVEHVRHHVQRTKKTVVPNPNEGNEYVT